MMTQTPSAMPPDPGEPDARDDLSLIAAINDGDSAAFESLYRRHRDWVVNLAWRFTGDRDLALDVLQETFLYLLRKFPGFTLTARLQTFLYPAVRHLSIAARRKKARLHSDEPIPELTPEPPRPPSADNPREHLAAALADLSDDHREVLLLRFVDELSIAEISAALNVPQGTIKSRLHNSLKILRSNERIKNFFNE